MRSSLTVLSVVVALLVLGLQVAPAGAQQLPREVTDSARQYRTDLRGHRTYRASPRNDEGSGWSITLFHHPTPSWGYFERQQQPVIRYSEDLYPGLRQHLRPGRTRYGYAPPPVTVYNYNYSYNTHYHYHNHYCVPW